MIKVNLMRPEKKDVGGSEKSAAYAGEAREAQLSKPAIIGGLAIGVAIILGLYFLQAKKITELKTTVSDRELEIKSLEGVLQKLKEAEDAKKAVDDKIKIIQDLKIKQKGTVLVMDKVSRCLPEWLWLTNFSYINNKLSISGQAMSNSIISDFISNLNNSTYFANVAIISSQSAKAGTSTQDVYNFSLSCTFVNSADETNKGG